MALNNSDHHHAPQETPRNQAAHQHLMKKSEQRGSLIPQKYLYSVKGMHCASCGSVITRTLKKLRGVEECAVNVATNTASISHDPTQTPVSEMNKALSKYGYTLVDESAAAVDHSEHAMQGGHHDHAAIPVSSELAAERSKALSMLPFTLFVFAAMAWENTANILPSFPPLPYPMIVWNWLQWAIASYALFGVGQLFLSAVWRFVKTRHADMNTLVGIGTLSAYLYSSFKIFFPTLSERIGLSEYLYFDVTIVVIGFILLGKFLESAAKQRTGEALQKLLKLQAKTAILLIDGEEREVPVAEVKVGDELVIKPGGQLPVDGVITQGLSAIDESMITGEPLPADKTVGDSVVAGTTNQQGRLVIRATKVGSETVLAHIVQMVQDAQSSKAPIERLADQVSAVFVPIVLVIAVLTFVVWAAIGSQFMPVQQALTLGFTCLIGVLVIACPCALGLATPTGMIVGVGRAAKHGILIKNAESLELLHSVNTIVMDKTGTLTHGKPEVTDLFIHTQTPEKEVLHVVGTLEQASEHPLSRAITQYVKEKQIKVSTVDAFKNLQGRGLTGKVDGQQYWIGNRALVTERKLEFESHHLVKLTAQGKTPLFLLDKKQVIAEIYVADTVKPTAAAAVEWLRKNKIEVVMLSGDTQQTAEFIAHQVGISRVIGEVLPAQKAAEIKRLKDQGRKVAMVGDGVNDAPALAYADVGIAMSTGTDIAISSAQITLLHGDISKLVAAIGLSRSTMSIIRQNLFWAFIYNVIGIPLAAGVLYPFAGVILNPIFAGLAMAFSSVSVVANSLRLKGAKVEGMAR